jgi:O-methyltransferase involved in polyketide biosynthesis
VLVDPIPRFDQVAVLGVGLDPKPLRFARGLQRWFGLDLPRMLENRARRLRECWLAASIFVAVPADLTSPDWPALFILEGVSMYLHREAPAAFLEKLAAPARAPASRMWMDHVSEDLLKMDDASVRGFLEGIEALGEPFKFGLRDLAIALSPSWECEATVSATGVAEPVHSEYLFSVLRSRTP